MYKSPIEIINSGVQARIEGEIIKAVQRYAIFVDRDELLQALKYDRKQYDNGYADGKADGVRHGRWIGTHDGLEYSYSCSECGYEALTEEGTMHDQVCSAYCPNCGARMDGDTNEQA